MKYVLILLLIFGLQAKGQVLHFDTVGCGIDVADTSYINKMVRHEGQFYNHLFDTHINDFLTLNINLYGNKGDFTKALKADNAKTFTNGIYLADVNRGFVLKNEIYIHVIMRAAGVNLLHNNYPNAPRWLIEGLGSVLAYSDEDGERMMTYTPTFDYNKKIKQLSWKKEETGEEGLDFDTLFMADNLDWDKKLSTAYGDLHALSYGIVYFLAEHDRAHFEPIVKALKQGCSAQDAIADSYGSFDEFKHQFIVYYRYAAKSKFSAQN